MVFISCVVYSQTTPLSNMSSDKLIERLKNKSNPNKFERSEIISILALKQDKEVSRF